MVKGEKSALKAVSGRGKETTLEGASALCKGQNKPARGAGLKGSPVIGVRDINHNVLPIWELQNIPYIA